MDTSNATIFEEALDFSKIDALIERGIYDSRLEFLQAAINNHIQQCFYHQQNTTVYNIINIHIGL